MFKKINTIEQLETIVGPVICDIGGRGGYVGFSGKTVSDFFNSRNIRLSEHDLPGKFGAFCNYLGGGMRGAICCSTFSSNVNKRTASYLNELSAACKRAYENAENDTGMNDDYPDGETNWEALATKASRNAGVVSAY
jgi:hypothetical protein